LPTYIVISDDSKNLNRILILFLVAYLLQSTDNNLLNFVH